MPKLPKQHVQINAIKPPKTGQVDYHGTETNAGLSLQVTHTGRKTWSVRYYIIRKGIRKRAKYKIGRFPSIDLKEARVIKREILAKIDKGEDPANDRKVEERKSAVKTIEVLCDEFFTIRATEKYRGRLRKNIKDEQSMSRCYIIPEIGAYAPQTVTSEDINLILTNAQKQCSAVRANRILALLRVIFKYALSKQYIDINPTLNIDPPGKEYPKEIDPPQTRELKELWSLIQKGSMTTAGVPILITRPIQIVLQLLLLTGQRSTEVSQAPIDEFDLEEKIWIISGERTKNGKPHKIPLSDIAVELINEAMELAKEDCESTMFLFPGWTGTNNFNRGEIPISKTAALKALKRVTAGSSLERFTLHDFRKICATQMAENGVLLEIISEILNHSINTVTARHYVKPSYLPQMRIALELWAAKLKEITEGVKAQSNVIQLKG